MGCQIQLSVVLLLFVILLGGILVWRVLLGCLLLLVGLFICLFVAVFGLGFEWLVVLGWLVEYDVRLVVVVYVGYVVLMCFVFYGLWVLIVLLAEYTFGVYVLPLLFGCVWLMIW